MYFLRETRKNAEPAEKPESSLNPKKAANSLHRLVFPRFPRPVTSYNKSAEDGVGLKKEVEQGARAPKFTLERPLL